MTVDEARHVAQLARNLGMGTADQRHLLLLLRALHRAGQPPADRALPGTAGHLRAARHAVVAVFNRTASAPGAVCPAPTYAELDALRTAVDLITLLAARLAGQPDEAALPQHHATAIA